ncbi:unnamed protein product [Sympodiomycopsis kandeliae]
MPLVTSLAARRLVTRSSTRSLSIMSGNDRKPPLGADSRPLSRIAALSRQLFPTSPFTTPASSRNASSSSAASTPVGNLQLGPDVSIPVYEPHDPLRLPMQRLLVSLNDPNVLQDLTWMGKKWQLNQDIFLLSSPGSYSRRLSLTFASFLQLPFEYISMHRDIGESELLQSRSLSAGGNLDYIDGPVVRAMKNGSVLIIEGVQRAERNVMPLLNNILENREANLPDGTQLVPLNRINTLKQDDTKADTKFIPVHPNFRVVALGLPIPPYKGLPLDPPFRSRFQSRWVESLVAASTPNQLPSYTIQPNLDQARQFSINLAQRLHDFSSLVRYHDAFARGGDILPETERLPTMPSTMLPLLEDIVQLFPPVQPLVPALPQQSTPQAKVEKEYPPPQDGALQVADYRRKLVEAREQETLSKFPPPRPQGKIAHQTVALLGTAWPQLYTVDETRRNIADNLLQSLSLDHGIGAGPEEVDSSTGLLGYNLESIERLSDIQSRITFTHQANPTNKVAIDAPSGPLPHNTLPRLGQSVQLNGQTITVTPRLLSILTTMAQLHATGRDFALLPSAFATKQKGTRPQSSSSTSTAIALFGSLLGYPVESIWLWKDVGGNELIMKRVTTESGDTTFEPSPLLKNASEAKIVHLAGIDLLGPTLGSLSTLIQDRTLELWKGGRATLLEAEGAKFPLEQTLPSKVGLGALTPLHPSFRLIATAASSKADWLNEEVSTLFSFASPSPMSDEEEMEIVCAQSNCSPDRLESLFAFARRYRELSSDPSLGLDKSGRLGTRSLIRMAKRLAEYPQTDLRSLLERNLLVEFLPRTNRDLVRNTLSECGLYPRGAEGAFQYLRPEFMADPRTQDGQLVFEDLNSLGSPEGSVRIPIFDAQQHGDIEGSERLIPSTGNFYNNPTQSLLLRDLAIDLQSEHLLLLGTQGTGKNKIIDRLCELLRRPREYIQLSRDSTVNSILQIIQLESGKLRYLDSPLIRAIKLGRICIIDEADKCSSAVTAIFKSLSERSQLTLPDGRQIRPVGSVAVSQDDIVIHPNFKCILLANRPGFPFLGNEFLSTLGQGFSPFVIGNPDLESEIRLLKQAAPNVDESLIKKLDLAFHDLRRQFDAGQINYPYSLRELLHIVRHLNQFPNESLVDVLLNTLSFDLHRPQAMEIVMEALKRRGLDVKGLSLSEIKEDKIKTAASGSPGKVDYDAKKEGKDTSLGGPKEGKHDPKNEEHHGGNTWRGGTGGRDTAGLGGRGGFERLSSGHQVKQISDELKKDVPDHIKEQARQMAKEALAKRLAQEGLTQHEAATYEAYKRELESATNHLVNVLNDLQANKKERHWLSGQEEGELDERRLTNALTGERSVFKKRSEAPPEIGAPMIKPKRLRFLIDCSASMYSMNFDGRLDRQIKSILMIMESFERLQDPTKYVYEIIGHSGESHDVPLVTINAPPKDIGSKWKILRNIISTTQFTMSGDNTIEGLSHSIKTLNNNEVQESSDDVILLALSDANLSRYGITSDVLRRTLSPNTANKVKSAIIFIGGEQEGERVAKELPGKAYVCKKLKNLPTLLSEILVGMVGKEDGQ